MGSKADYLENAYLDHILKTSALGVPTNLYVALCKSTIADDDTGSTLPSEATGGAYARKTCNTWDAAAAGASENSQPITFVTATAVWGTVTDWALLDHSTTGKLLYYGKLTTSKKIATDDTAKFATGDIDITES